MADLYQGVPDPTPDFGYDPRTIPIPDDPPEWPSAESTTHYYVDPTHPASTDTGNVYGYPDKPRKTTWIAGNRSIEAGATIIFAGGSHGSHFIDCTLGTSGSPIFITFRNGANFNSGYLGMYGCRHTIIDGLIGGCLDNVNVLFDNGAEYCTLRNCVLRGDNSVYFGQSTVVRIVGASGAVTNHIYMYNNITTNFGERFSDTSWQANDAHAVKIERWVEDVWYIDCYSRRMAGDAMQIGGTGFADASRPRRCYVGGLVSHNQGENCFDTKDSYDCVFSESWGWETYTTATSGGSLAAQTQNTYANNLQYYKVRFHTAQYGLAIGTGHVTVLQDSLNYDDTWDDFWVFITEENKQYLTERGTRYHTYTDDWGDIQYGVSSLYSPTGLSFSAGPTIVSNAGGIVDASATVDSQ